MNNGLLNVALDGAIVENLPAGAAAEHEITVDLGDCAVRMDAESYGFSIDPGIRSRLRSGMEMIDEALGQLAGIRAGDTALERQTSWLDSMHATA